VILVSVGVHCYRNTCRDGGGDDDGCSFQLSAAFARSLPPVYVPSGGSITQRKQRVGYEN
jgi:hypothetical protein